eukprot:TRINITY_DN9110_c0_g2_i5.p1 TRINITY_DN9110_c0_g2~~TRINITY_DN9110_c0_g2_i5.p1  ORF type:complete len:197 (+),score=4.89 TRINITY_DN9110_c0_g2_i5:174-764(+)
MDSHYFYLLLILFVTVAMLFSSQLSLYLCHIVGLVYPAFATHESISSHSQDQHQLWLTYWSVYGFICAMESIFSLVPLIVPLYYEIKLLFICWMLIPSAQESGAQIVYEQKVRPFIEKNQQQLTPLAKVVEGFLESPAIPMVVKAVQKYGPFVSVMVQERLQLVAGKFSNQLISQYLLDNNKKQDELIEEFDHGSD